MKSSPERPTRPSSFEQTAIQLDCQDDEAEFDKRLRAIATVKAVRDRGKVAGDQGEGDDPKVAAPARKGE